MTLALNKMLIGWFLGALAIMVLVSCGESSPTTEKGGPTDQTQRVADAAKPSNTPDTSSGLTLIPATTKPTPGNPIVETDRAPHPLGLGVLRFDHRLPTLSCQHHPYTIRMGTLASIASFYFTPGSRLNL